MGIVMDEVSQEHVVELSRHLDAPVQAVWQALTDGDALTSWYWPAGLDPQARTDPRPGGRYAITSAAPGMGIQGEYVAIDAPRRVSMTWRWDGDDTESLVIVELTEQAGGTGLDLRHEHLDRLTAVNYRAGWESCLDRLPAYLAAHR